MSESQIIEIYNQGISQVINLIKALSKEIKSLRTTSGKNLVYKKVTKNQLYA